MFFRYSFVGLCACVLALGNLAQAQAPGTSLSAAYVRMPDTNLDTSGKASVDTVQLSFSHTAALSRDTTLGLQLRFDQEDWQFDGANKFGSAPWGKLQRFGLGVPYLQGLGNGWSLMLTPRAEWAMEDGADSGEAVSLGLIGGAMRNFGPGQRVGFGLAASRALDDDYEVFPFVIVDWRFNEQWRLFNPLGLGLSGPAGLEMAYRLGDKLELGLGGSWRVARFRLANDNAQSAGGIGVFSYVPVFVHMSWKPATAVSLDAYAGWALNGRIKIQDANGNDLRSEGLANAPIFGLSASFRF